MLKHRLGSYQWVLRRAVGHNGACAYVEWCVFMAVPLKVTSGPHAVRRQSRDNTIGDGQHSGDWWPTGVCGAGACRTSRTTDMCGRRESHDTITK